VAYAIAQVQLFRALLERAEETLQPPAQVGGFADIGLRVGVFSAELEHCGAGGQSLEELRIPLWREFQTLGQHLNIVWELQAGNRLTEAGAAVFLAEVGAVESDDATHFVQAGAHAFSDAIAQGFSTAGRAGRRD